MGVSHIKHVRVCVYVFVAPLLAGKTFPGVVRSDFARKSSVLMVDQKAKETQKVGINDRMN